MKQQSLFLLCQEDTYFAQKPLGAKESHEDVARPARRAESHSSAALPAPGSGAEAGSSPFLFAPPAAPSQVSSLMLFWIPHHASRSTVASPSSSSFHPAVDTATLPSPGKLCQRRVHAPAVFPGWSRPGQALLSFRVLSYHPSSKETGKPTPDNKSPFPCVLCLKIACLNTITFFFFCGIKYSSHFCSTALQLTCSSQVHR